MFLKICFMKSTLTYNLKVIMHCISCNGNISLATVDLLQREKKRLISQQAPQQTRYSAYAEYAVIFRFCGQYFS